MGGQGGKKPDVNGAGNGTFNPASLSCSPPQFSPPPPPPHTHTQQAYLSLQDQTFMAMHRLMRSVSNPEKETSLFSCSFWSSYFKVSYPVVRWNSCMNFSRRSSFTYIFPAREALRHAYFFFPQTLLVSYSLSSAQHLLDLIYRQYVCPRRTVFLIMIT